VIGPSKLIASKVGVLYANRKEQRSPKARIQLGSISTKVKERFIHGSSLRAVVGVADRK
jgi:hypothetical protein